MSNFVPPDYQHRLQSAGQQSDDSSWEIGDIALELEKRQMQVLFEDGEKKEVLVYYEKEREMTRDEFWRGIGTWCGKSGGTVRDCHRISKSVPKYIRYRYDMLSRSHFRVMIPYFETDDELKQLCEQALEWGDDYGGRIISVEALTRKLKQDNGEPPAWIAWLKRLLRNAEKIRDHEETPPDVAGWAGDVVRDAPQEDE